MLFQHVFEMLFLMRVQGNERKNEISILQIIRVVITGYERPGISRISIKTIQVISNIYVSTTEQTYIFIHATHGKF